MTDYTKAIYDFLKVVWDQDTYPADIDYVDPQVDPEDKMSDNNIVLSIIAGNITSEPLSTNFRPHFDRNIVHIFVAITDPQLEERAKKQQLKNIYDELESKLDTINDTLTETFEIATGLDDGYYNLVANLKAMTTEALTMGRDGPLGDTYTGIFIFDLDELATTLLNLTDVVTISNATINMNVAGDNTDAEEGFEIDLIDDDDVNYPNADPGAPPKVGIPVTWSGPGGTGTKTTPDLSTLILSYVARATRNSTETRMGIAIDAVHTGAQNDFLFVEAYEDAGTDEAILTVVYTIGIDAHLIQAIPVPETERTVLDVWLEVREVV